MSQRDRQLGTMPRNGGPGDRHKDVEPSSGPALPIDTASDSNRERPGELDRAASDLLVERVAFRGWLTTDEEEPVALFRLGDDRLFAGLLDPSGDLNRITPRFRWTCFVAFLCTLLHDRSGAFGLPGALAARTGRFIVEMNDSRGNVPGAS